MLVFAIMVIVFLLIQFTLPKDSEIGKDKISFTVPRSIIVNEDPELSLMVKEKRRRKLLNEVYTLGFYAREFLERKHKEDRLIK